MRPHSDTSAPSKSPTSAAGSAGALAEPGNLTADIQAIRSTLDALPQIDLNKMRLDRLARLQNELSARNVDGILLYDPINVRYATDCRNMQIWTMHNSARYCLVPTEGKAVMFDFVGSQHLADGNPTISESRPGILWYNHTAGSKRDDLIEDWADDLASVVRETCPGSTIVTDRLDADGRAALEKRQIAVSFGQDIIERARCIKTEEELKAQRHSAAVCEGALAAMRRQTAPGVSENELWATLVAVNSNLGGDYIETRLVLSGENTNPWYNEASERKVQAGDLVAIDTDMIGPFGYNTDISRTWLCHPGKPSAEQKTIYQLAYEQIHHNMSLLRAGQSFREYAEQSWKMPERYRELDCRVLVHGTGMCNEYPQIPSHPHFERTGYDGMFAENMTVSVESYIGEVGKNDGVKLEQMVRITKDGFELIANFPFEDELLG